MEAHDETGVNAKAQADAKRRAREEVEDMRWLLSGQRGRRIVYRQLEAAGVFRLSFNTNAMAMSFAEGQRNTGLQLLAQVMAVRPDAYALMVKENTDDARNPDDAAAPSDQ